MKKIEIVGTQFETENFSAFSPLEHLDGFSLATDCEVCCPGSCTGCTQCNSCNLLF